MTRARALGAFGFALSLSFAPAVQAKAPSAATAPHSPSFEHSVRTDGVGLAGDGLRVESALWSETRAHTIRGALSPVSLGFLAAPDPIALARSAVANQAGVMKIDAETLEFVSTTDSILGTTVRFQRMVDGLPVEPGAVVAQVSKQGQVTWISSEGPADEALPLAKRGPAASASRDQILSSALESLGVGATLRGEAQLRKVLDAEHGEVYEVILPAANPLGDFFLAVTLDGQVLSSENRLHFATGKVFNPSPVVVLQDTSISDSGDGAVPEGAYSTVELQGLDNSGTLTGQFVDTSLTNNRATSDNGEFHYDRSNKHFEEVMVYFHIDATQRYFQSLGFNNVNNRVQKVHAHGTTDDNSFYSPWNKNLTFGDGGVDDAEDADIIWHEYGHSTQDNQVPGWGNGGHARAMGEAFGDYLAGVMGERLSGFHSACVGDWDATSYAGGSEPCLRRLDGSKHFPEDLQGQEHADGEIWSAALWEIHNGIGNADDAARLVLAHHFLLAPGATMPQAAEAMLQADENLYQGANQDIIRSVFESRGILTAAGRGAARANTVATER